MKSLSKSVVLATLFSFSLSAYALKSDAEKQINIDAGSQSLDINTNTVIFSNNVIITQGSIKVTANKVKITRQTGKKETLDATGSPVTFQQTLDNGKPVKGKGNTVHYDLNSEFLTLTGNAELKQQGSFIQADKITYDVKKQKLTAGSGNNSRVKTILIPTELNQQKQ
ncbi:lipopolysaccharide transport periplasmic protein LptA [[Haemophilus] ducreyi]|uniref:lipopolysaccharide transport periplasmic protein LptA n=1 Tax=Haemophilus ducreyi TaxID=730 RepID=UPI00065585F9|nr:lipopolysaccharide transport periplasmic protein LptA [[Haemophilus] ducreyi]AKO45078.1 ABC transporter substrate-binding protein [[Haemophilus] ducreyi]AKO46480.1 ABC transporter substrate-binding protein [[Haemophilus] ducreyi]OOS03151.1 lipopolysaccharide transport periplasmic protein LptA [[Haemophilus] ducreyi]SEV89615.1 lipopolysaccharide export system protein LptA [[Haemophilus] ducreyi]VEG83275.1 ABC transporter periplasmic-binding protein [[Haemophilus] ducreyi]